MSAVTPAVGQERCDTAAGGSGGDWTYYGGDMANSRHQTAEDVIGTDNAADLTPDWTYTTSGFIANATVVGDCVFITNEPQFTHAHVIALKLDTGEEVWRQPVLPDEIPVTAGAWAAPSGAPTVVDGRVHVNVTGPVADIGRGAYGAAFDAATGARLWTSEPIHFGYTTNNQASPAVWNGVHTISTVGPDGDASSREGYALLDAATGEVLHAQTTFSDVDIEDGHTGGGIWTMPAVDVETGHFIVGTSNPNTSQKEHDYDNAMIKVDMDPTALDDGPRPTFGTIVDSYKGNPDNWLYPGGYNNPTCYTVTPIPLFVVNSGGYNLMCGQLDVDFGASPTLVEHPSGRTLVGASQKTGWFHMADADTMNIVWSRMMTHPNAVQGMSSAAANDGERVYVAANPGVMIAYDALTGDQLWAQPLGDGLSHHPVTLANGVVYIVSNGGLLHAFDAESGVPLNVWSIGEMLGDTCWQSLSAAVTVAQHTVLVTCDQTWSSGGGLVALRLPN